MTTYVLKLPYTKPPLSLNYRLSRWAEIREKQQIHHDVIMLALYNKLPKGRPSAKITLEWWPGTIRKRDTDNPTPTLKACIDALVKYGLIRDDSSEIVKSEVVICGLRRPAEMKLIIEVPE